MAARGLGMGGKVLAFVKGLPAQVIDPGQSSVSRTQARLGVELDRPVLLAQHDGTHVRLAGADDAPGWTTPATVVRRGDR